MTITSASDAIESLLEMAEQGEIDPWDVQVIDVIDRFLAELGLLNDLDLAMAQANLPQSGQAFLWASMLVLFKADTLERLSLDQQEESLIDEEISELERELRTLPRYLENHIRRRTAAPPPRKRRVTLQELITQLQQIALEIEALPKLPVVVPKPRPQSRREAVQIITELKPNWRAAHIAVGAGAVLPTAVVGIVASVALLRWRPWGQILAIVA
ncbi:MAG: segregation/condensation protein A, partial [Microcystis aeruginosa]